MLTDQCFAIFSGLEGLAGSALRILLGDVGFVGEVCLEGDEKEVFAGLEGFA